MVGLLDMLEFVGTDRETFNRINIVEHYDYIIIDRGVKINIINSGNHNLTGVDFLALYSMK